MQKNIESEMTLKRSYLDIFELQNQLIDLTLSMETLLKKEQLPELRLRIHRVLRIINETY